MTRLRQSRHCLPPKPIMLYAWSCLQDFPASRALLRMLSRLRTSAYHLGAVLTGLLCGCSKGLS
jgi:hypothetical protein